MKLKKISHSLILGFLALFMIISTEKAHSASLERFIVSSAVGAGIGQAIGRNTQSTLMGAAAAVILDGYFKPDFMGEHPITSHLPGFQPARYSGNQPAYYRTQPPPRYIVEQHQPQDTTVTTTSTSTTFQGNPNSRGMRSHYKRHARKHQQEVHRNQYVRYENPNWW